MLRGFVQPIRGRSGIQVRGAPIASEDCQVFTLERCPTRRSILYSLIPSAEAMARIFRRECQAAAVPGPSTQLVECITASTITFTCSALSFKSVAETRAEAPCATEFRIESADRNTSTSRSWCSMKCSNLSFQSISNLAGNSEIAEQL